MLRVSNAQGFFQEFGALLEKHGVDTHFMTVVSHGDTTHTADAPLTYNVSGIQERNLTAQRLSAVFAESVLGGVLRMMIKYNGLTLYQAIGAMQESARAAAVAIEAEQDAHRAVMAQGVGDLS